MTDVDWHAAFDRRGIGWYCGYIFPFPDDLFVLTTDRLLDQPRCGRWHSSREEREACDHGDPVVTPSRAVISEDGVYRYVLRREWPGGDGNVLWIMLNPSVADAHTDDPTVGRCVTFSSRWGYQRLTIVNLFAYRATEPAELKFAPVSIVGPDNHRHVEEQMVAADRIMCAWGANPFTHNPHRPNVLAIAAAHHLDLYCLGTTSKGAPKHPLCVPAKQRPILWRKP